MNRAMGLAFYSDPAAPASGKTQHLALFHRPDRIDLCRYVSMLAQGGAAHG
jgi:hypothetical protein